MSKKEKLNKQYELFKEGYSIKEVAMLMDKSRFSVMIDLFHLLKNGYQSMLIK